MKQIEISIDVFARIWALRESGEGSEDAILRRVLNCVPTASIVSARTASLPSGGFWDKRHNIHFPEGFEIFRTYKGSFYSAQAKSGKWLLSDGRWFGSLNELSRAVVSGSENAWVNWSFRGQHGTAQKLSELRNQENVTKRQPDAASSDRRNVSKDGDMGSSVTWRDDVVAALKSLDGCASLERIYRVVEQIRQARGATLPPSLEAVVRRELENNSSDSASYMGRYDLFYSAEGLGGGVWGLR